MGVGAESTGGGAEELERITARLEQLAVELEGDVEEERAAALVREASELASQAGRAVEGALRGPSDAPEE
jgi:exonuclease VII small subunit